MAGNDDYQLTGFLLSPALHWHPCICTGWRRWRRCRSGVQVMGGPGPGHLILINYPQ